MPYSHQESRAGDLIESRTWNAMGLEIQRLSGSLADGEQGKALTVTTDMVVGRESEGRYLRVLRRQQKGTEAGDGALVLGSDTPTSASLRLGYAKEYGWVQAAGQTALSLNPGGGNIGVNTGTPRSPLSVAGGAAVGGGYAATRAAPANGLIVEGSMGIGTHAPRAKLQVAGGAIMPEAGNTEEAGLLFPKDPAGGGSDAAWLRYYAREGEHCTLELGIANDAQDHIALMPSGFVGIGTRTPSHRLHVVAGNEVGLFESTGEQAYLRISTREGLQNRVELANRPGGRLALWVAGGSDAFNITRDGKIGFGVIDPRTDVDFGKDVAVGPPNDYAKAQYTLSGGGTVSWDGTTLRWTQRFIAIAMGRARSFATGHVNIAAGSAALTAWQALYAIHTVGSGENVVEMRTINYTDAVDVPSNWILVAVMNADTGTLKLGTGAILPKGGRIGVLNEAWEAAAFEHGWVNYGGSYGGGAYLKDDRGFVYLRGLVKAGLVGGDRTIFRLPVNCRPAARGLFAACTSPNTIGRVDVETDGRVIPVQVNPGWVSLDNIVFRAAQ